MSEEDDWFERAMRDLDGESDRSGDEEGDETAVGDEEGDEAAVGDEDDEAGEGVADLDGEAGETGDGHEDDPFGGVRDETDVAESEGADDPGDPFGGGSFGDAGEAVENAREEPSEERSLGEDAGDDLGEGDFGGGDFDEGEFGDPDPSGTDEGDADDPFGGSRGGGGDPFDGSGGGGDPFGAGSFGDDDPFGGYRGSGSTSSEEFGFGDFGGGGGDAGGETETGFDVDPDEFESALDRTDVGIEGLDDMILGGVPSRSLLSVIGGAGTGKTTFALQFLNRALESDGKGVYITLEQTRESILATADEKGWAFREAADEDRLAVVAIDPIEMANSLASIRNDLTRLIAEFDADRLVLDSVSLLEMMYDHPAKRRSEVFGFTRSLKEAGVTTLLTSEASEENPYASRHGIVEYLTDAVFVLQYIRGSDFRETRLAVEIQKIRDANHSRETKPYEITDTGISVYGQANIF